ncbi:MAG: hypothetical protein CL916_09005 [Deltaproteobacteria bacterium]|nr:hypothetical protein [Deltaproteobacteria bacterium]
MKANNMKYSIPAVGAIAVSMTACLESTSGAAGEWEATEFNGQETAVPYSTYYDENTYLALTMSLDSIDAEGGYATATWELTGATAETTSLSGDYVIQEDGSYDILLKASSGAPSEINLICTLAEDEMDCTTGSMKSTASSDAADLGPSYFIQAAAKTE